MGGWLFCGCVFLRFQVRCILVFLVADIVCQGSSRVGSLFRLNLGLYIPRPPVPLDRAVGWRWIIAFFLNRWSTRPQPNGCLTQECGSPAGQLQLGDWGHIPERQLVLFI